MTSITNVANHVQENLPPNSPKFANLRIAEDAPTGLRAGLGLQDAQHYADEMDEGQEYQEQLDGQDAEEGLQDAQGGDQVTWHRYKYAEYDGFYGREKLDNDLNAVISSAAKRFWAGCNSCGPICYAGNEEIARRMRRHLRQAERGIKYMRGYRLGHRELRMVNGIPRYVWNFEALYDLAYEYRQWCKSPLYIEAKRENLPVILAMIEESSELGAQLLRYYEYRRLFCADPREEEEAEDLLAKDTQKMQEMLKRQKLQNSTLLSAVLSAERLYEETNSNTRNTTKEKGTNSNAEKGTVFSPAKTIRRSGNNTEPQQVRPPYPTPNQEPSIPNLQQSNFVSPAPVEDVESDESGEMRLSTAEKVAVVTGIPTEHQQQGRKGKDQDRPRLPGHLAKRLSELSLEFGDDAPGSSQTDLACLYLRARVATKEQLSPDMFFTVMVAPFEHQIRRMLERGEIEARLKDNPNVAKGMPLFLKRIRKAVEKLEKQAQKQRKQEDQVAYLARRFRESQAQSHAPAPASTPAPDEVQESEDDAPPSPSPEAPPVASPGDGNELARLQTELKHPNPAIRRAAAHRLYAHGQLSRLQELGVSSPTVYPHHCFCYYEYTPTPGAEPCCVACDPDPSWPDEVHAIVEATKHYKITGSRQSYRSLK